MPFQMSVVEPILTLNCDLRLDCSSNSDQSNPSVDNTKKNKIKRDFSKQTF